MGEQEWLKAPRMNGARGWSRIRRTYALAAVVTGGFVAVEAVLLAAAWLSIELRFEPALLLYLFATLGGFTLLPFVAVCVLGYQGLRRGLGVAPLLVGLGLWASLCVGLGGSDGRDWLPLVSLAVLPAAAALLTHPRRRQVESAAR
jgi:hypothetical protein